jgi:hypothetical protein
VSPVINGVSVVRRLRLGRCPCYVQRLPFSATGAPLFLAIGRVVECGVVRGLCLVCANKRIIETPSVVCDDRGTTNYPYHNPTTPHGRVRGHFRQVLPTCVPTFHQGIRIGELLCSERPANGLGRSIHARNDPFGTGPVCCQALGVNSPPHSPNLLFPTFWKGRSLFAGSRDKLVFLGCEKRIIEPLTAVCGDRGASNRVVISHRLRGP